ncbi:MAG TPA: acetoacetate decarboxylase family protein [Candidatus Bathyarchaeia archaeon]|nr:acetoacetate decarboxylase family protein [Candidatus Bathyarchaeia archaeon]
MTSERNNLPLHSPLYPTPFVPYSCPRNRTLTVICEGNLDSINEILSYTPFQFASNNFVISVSDFENCSAIPFMDVGVIFPVKFRDLIGGFWAYEYEDNDESIAAGRELWGYPKKFASAKLEEKGNHVMAVVERKGVKLIEVELTLTGDPVPEIRTYPHLLLQVIPNAEKPGVFLKRILARDTSPDFVTKDRKTGTATVAFGKLDSDPIFKLGPTKVLGGVYTVGDFFATEKNGWAKIISTL